MSAAQRDIDGTFFELQGAVERTAVELGEFLLTRYNDGFVQDEEGRPQQPGYPSEWLHRVLEEKGDRLALPTWGEESH